MSTSRVTPWFDRTIMLPIEVWFGVLRDWLFRAKVPQTIVIVLMLCLATTIVGLLFVLWLVVVSIEATLRLASILILTIVSRLR